MIELTRRYAFPAAHVLRSRSLDDAANERIYGKCANPAGHGHDYGLEVSIAGPVDPRTGAILPVAMLDAIVEERVLRRLSHRMLNEDPWFHDDVPTAEHIARAIERELRSAVAAATTARVVRVRVIETRRNIFSCGEDDA